MTTFRDDVRIEIFPDKIRKLVDTPNSRFGRLVKSRAESVLAASRPLIGKKYSGHHPENGSLRDAGAVVSVGGASWKVVYSHPIAFLHHNGSKPHTISPKEGGYLFRAGPSPVDAAGSGRFGPWGGSVAHPGTQPNPFLVNAAKQVGLRLSGSLRRGTDLVPIARSGGFF